MKPFVRGDLEGFFAFSLDSLLTYILMSQLCLGFLGFSEELFFYRILPATAVGLIVGNLFYAWQALQLAKRENRDDVCAIPYGTSAITIVIYVFLIIFPTQQKALAVGMSKEEADIIAWHTGILACVLSGMIEFFGAFVVDYIRRATPRIVLLVAKAGTALAFLSLDYVFRTFAHPILGFTSLSLVLIFYFGGVRLRSGIPAGFVILAIGTGLAWLMTWGGYSSVVPAGNFDLSYFGLHFPVPEITRIFASFDFIAEFLPVVIPFGFIFLIGSLQNIESAAAAGDEYRPRPLLLMNGVGSLTAAAFGSPFPTTIFLGHPGYKQIGARAGYSTLNAICWTAVCLTGVLSAVTYVIPIEAVMPIIIWLGVVICAQNFQVADVKHMPAIVIGLLPAIAAYVGLAIEHTLVVAGRVTGTNLFGPELIGSFESMRGFYADGVFTLSQGYIYLCMIWAGITYYVIEHRFNTAAIWCGVGALLSLVGFTHLYRFSGSDVIGVFALPVPVWSKWTAAYLIMAVIFLVTARLIREDASRAATAAPGPRV